MGRRSFLRRDDGVTEVIGYVLSFALSAIFLLLALNVFWAARENTESVTTAVELKTIADRVSTRIVELGAVSQEFPNASMNVTLVIPQTLNGSPYLITLHPEYVEAKLRDDSLVATATTFNVHKLDGIILGGSVDSSNEKLVVQYYPDGATRRVRISGE